MELRESKNYKDEPLYDLYDDNGKFVMETTTVEVDAKGKSYIGRVIGNNKYTLKIVSGSTTRLIELSDITRLIRIKGIEP